METIDEENFKEILYSDDRDDIIFGYVVEIKNRLNINLEEVNLATSFSNITFKGNSLKFYRHNQEQIHSLEFLNCNFLCDTDFNNCNLNEINFTSNTLNLNTFKISNCKIRDFSFKDDNVFEKGKLEINKCEFESFFDLDKIKFFDNSSLKIDSTNFNCPVTIVNSEINQLIISHCFFKNNFEYLGNKPNNNSNSIFFNNCEFNYSSFFKTKFNYNTHFADCKFLNIAKFESTGEEIKTLLKFENCEFSKQVSFNNSRIHKILFKNLKFYDIISLQETYFDIVDIERTIFDKQAYFDDIQIKQIYNCNTRTIRAIKLQLQKAENKIDYNRFRVYEFNAYRNDIKRKLNEFKEDKNHLNHRVREPIQLKRDAFILKISDLVSEYGTDWKRALYFTTISGFISFLFFYILENWNYSFDIKCYQDFLYGSLRFFLITDFKNEYYESGESVLKFNCFISLFPFIIGKIAVAFGLYEMIQSFRKFKA